MLDAIKEMCPDTYIGYTCYEDMVETCNLCPSVDEIFIQPRILPVMNNVGGTRLLNCSVMEESINRIREAKIDRVPCQYTMQSWKRSKNHNRCCAFIL